MRLRNAWVGILGMSLAVTIACGGGGSDTSKPAETAAPAAGATGGGPKVDAATAGSIKGKVTLDGAAPKNEPIKMNADPVCLTQAKGPQAQETYMVGSDGK